MIRPNAFRPLIRLLDQGDCVCDATGKCYYHQRQEEASLAVDALVNVSDEEQDRRMAAAFGPLWTGKGKK